MGAIKYGSVCSGVEAATVAWHKKGLIEETTYRSEGQRKERKGVVSNGRVGEQN
jgi:hypothetical protein